MKINLVLLTLCMLVHTSLLAQTNELQRSTPEAEGVPSEAIITLFDSLTALPHTDIHSVIVLRHGKVIGENFIQLLSHLNIAIQCTLAPKPL